MKSKQTARRVYFVGDDYSNVVYWKNNSDGAGTYRWAKGMTPFKARALAKQMPCQPRRIYKLVPVDDIDEVVGADLAQQRDDTNAE